jgi:hypothetical protein
MLIDQKSAAKSKFFFVGFRVGRPGFLLGGVISLKFLCELSAEIYLSEKIIIQHFKRPIFDKRLVIESA